MNKNSEQNLIGKSKKDAEEWCLKRKSNPKCTIVPYKAAITMQARKNELVCFLGEDGLIAGCSFYK